MKLIQYFDGHIVINLFGVLIRIKYSFPYKCPEVKEVGVTGNSDLQEPVIVSLTSFPQRINIVVKTIKTLLTQTMKPDMVILWLAPEQFPNGEKDLPDELLDLKQYGLTIDWYKDIRSYKKIIPSLKKYPNAVIITTDDDIYYAPDTVETLYNSYLEHRDEIQAHRCDWLKISPPPIKGGNDAYDVQLTWEKTRELYLDKHRGKASFFNRLTGYGAVLYPPNCFYKDVLDEDIIKNTIPTHDDIWLWAMAVLNGVKTRLVKGYSESINYVEDSQQYGLCKVNKKGVGMSLEEAYKIMFEKYPKLKKFLQEETEL